MTLNVPVGAVDSSMADHQVLFGQGVATHETRALLIANEQISIDRHDVELCSPASTS